MKEKQYLVANADIVAALNKYINVWEILATVFSMTS